MLKSSPAVSAKKILLLILLSIFVIEALLMLVFHVIGLKCSPAIILFDALFLVVFLIPFLYFLVYKPLVDSNRELQAALNEIKTLKGVIPICGYCKKIRDDKEVWHQLEDYLIENSEAVFSHGICPDCYEEQIAEVKKMKQQPPKQTDL